MVWEEMSFEEFQDGHGGHLERYLYVAMICNIGWHNQLDNRLIDQLELVFVKHYAPNCLTLTLFDSNTA